ncbi:hypothetical protein ABPG77_000033 [Micractinium sp. CCAP 211/92]
MAARPSLPGPTSAAQLSRWADLPPELLRAALAGAEEWFDPPPGWDTQEQTSLEDTPLTLADLLHAASACRSWRHALSQSPPLGSLTVGARPAGQQAWMERVRPGVRCLRLHFSAAGPQGQALLRALRPEVVELSGSGRQGEQDRGAAELVAGPPAGEDSSAAAAPSPLHSLSVDLSHATLDLTAMPALASLDICVDELAGSDTLAGATALTHLSIGSTSEPPNAPPVAEHLKTMVWKGGFRCYPWKYC